MQYTTQIRLPFVGAVFFSLPQLCRLVVAPQGCTVVSVQMGHGGRCGLCIRWFRHVPLAGCRGRNPKVR